jgi:selenocysteine lyase/cysteine desulfurase
LEVCLDRVSGRRRIVLSPFEHPIEAAVAAWAADEPTGDTVTILKGGDDLTDLSSNEVADLVLHRLRDEIRLAASARQKLIFIISEVCWATGQVIPVNDIIAALPDADRDRLLVVVDGAHVPGNRYSLESLTTADFYVMSAHKWLCCPEPCGILVSNDRHGHERPYDSWRSSAPEAWSSAWAICYLLATLEMWRELGVAEIVSRPREMRIVFEDHLHSAYRIVGAKSDMPQTSMLAIEPKPGFHWVTEPKDFLANRGIIAASVGLGDSPLWLRIAFPFFLEVGEVRRLTRVLARAFAEDGGPTRSGRISLGERSP